LAVLDQLANRHWKCSHSVQILKSHGYPHAPLATKAIEDELLRYSNAIRLVDDLTIIKA
jgi:hypothetical protein